MSAAFSSANIDVTTSSTAATALSLTLARKRYAFDERERIKKRRKQLNPVRLSLLEHTSDPPYDVEISDTESEKHINYSYRLQSPITTPTLTTATQNFKIIKPVANLKVEPQADSTSIATSLATPTTFAVKEPSISFKIDPEEPIISCKVEPTSPPLSPHTNTLSEGEALPLNLTKNARTEDNFVKVEPKAESSASPLPPPPRLLYSPRKEELSKSSNSSSSNGSGGNNSLPPSESPNSYEHFIVSASSDDKKDQSPPFSPRTPPVTIMRSLFTNAVTRTTCRIFNPEAFCNICNKEFCNKYFLKTHKANKHGVYCETKDTSMDPVAELPTVPLMFTWNVKNNSVKLPPNPYLFNNSASIASATATSITTIKDSSAFCSICEKEFCNKYFLRRHKEKMHGIAPSIDSRKSETESEKSEFDDAERTPPTSNATNTTIAIGGEETKPSFFNTIESKHNNELNHNTPGDKLKYHKAYVTSATDAVSDFIKICLTNSTVKSTPKNEPPDQALVDGEIADYGFIKREEGVNFDNISKMIAERGTSNRYDERQQGNGAADYSLHQQLTKYDDSGQDLGKKTLMLPHTFDDQDNRLSPPRYVCELCKKFLSTYSILRLHQKYVHALTLEESTTDEDDLEFKHIENAYFMILKFSWLNTAVTYCEICKSEFEKSDALEMHLMNQHGTLVDELSRVIEDASANGLSAPALSTGDGHIICQICNKTFNTNAAFQQHVYEKCTYPEYRECGAVAAGGAVMLGDENGSNNESSKSTRNFCEICKKELCNKYFMKTHMRRMHGIAIQNGVRIGGVKCEICNKELCSKYFLRVHKKNCHGIMENVQQFARLLLQDCDKLEDVVQLQQQQQLQPRHASQVCAVCGRIFKSLKWLKTHLLGDHGKLGTNVWRDITGFGVMDATIESASEGGGGGGGGGGGSGVDETCSPNDDEKYSAPSAYQCSRCQFQASSVDLLLAHQRLHVKPLDQLQYRCLYCFVVTKDKVALEEHIAYHHFGNTELLEKNEFLSQYLVADKDSENCDTKSLISVRKMDHENT